MAEPANSVVVEGLKVSPEFRCSYVTGVLESTLREVIRLRDEKWQGSCAKRFDLARENAQRALDMADQILGRAGVSQ